MRRAFALATAGVLAFGGCGSIKERKENADRIIDSVDAAMAAKSARMTVTVQAELKLDRDASRLAGVPTAAGTSGLAGESPRVTYSAAADLARGRVAYLDAAPDGTGEPWLVYSDVRTIFARRAAPAASNTTQRPWVRIDLTGIDADEIDNDDVELPQALLRLSRTQGSDNPLFLLTLLRGALSGSVQEIGKEVVDDAPTTHYRFNIDREKAVRDEDEDVQDAFEVVFTSLFATRTVFPGEVWLDDAGLPRRYSVTLKPKLRRRDLADLHLTVELVEVGQPVAVAVPGKSETAKVDTLGLFDQAVGRGDQ